MTPPPSLTWCWIATQGPRLELVVITTMSGQQQTAWLHYTGTRLAPAQHLSPLSNKLDLMARHSLPVVSCGVAREVLKLIGNSEFTYKARLRSRNKTLEID